VHSTVMRLTSENKNRTAAMRDPRAAVLLIVKKLPAAILSGVVYFIIVSELFSLLPHRSACGSTCISCRNRTSMVHSCRAFSF